MIADGSQFGRPGKGFTVTNPKSDAHGGVGGDGLVVDAKDVKVQGNQFIADSAAAVPGFGIAALDSTPGPVLIQGNQVLLWGNAGIFSRGAGKTVRKNQLALNLTGIDAGGTAGVTGNVVSDNEEGIGLSESASATGNAVYGSSASGIFALGPSGTVTKNNVFGNDDATNCGVANNGTPTLDATDNYWGAPTGPGPDPADQSCAVGGGTNATSPFAAKPFHVKAPIKP